MSFFWEYALLLFIISGFLMSFFLLFKKKASLFKNKLFLLFSFLLAYNTFLTLYSWAQSDGKFHNLLAYALLIPFILYSILIYLFSAHPDFGNEHVQTISLEHGHIKYEKTGLSEAFSLELKNKLENLMHTQKLYLKHELRLDDIAEMLDVSRHHASQVINENFNKSFYDYVNAYRIKEAKRKLCADFDSSVQSISDIAYQCGFNNRVSFYKAFKKITNTTPTEFIAKDA